MTLLREAFVFNDNLCFCFILDSNGAPRGASARCD